MCVCVWGGGGGVVRSNVCALNIFLKFLYESMILIITAQVKIFKDE